MIRSGIQCRTLSNPPPRLHAKVYIFGNSNAIVTSANLTNKAFHSNIEVGCEVDCSQISPLQNWFDLLWQSASTLTIEGLGKFQKSIAKLRQRFADLKQESEVALSTIEPKAAAKVLLTDSLQHLFENAKQFFVCNTDRLHGEKTPAGGFEIEQEMYNSGAAIAWETFNYVSHMQQVETGDAIFMHAKGVGIVGIGVATGRCQSLPPNTPGRLFHLQTTEWRVPTKWLVWADESSAFPYRSPNKTFWNVSLLKYEAFRLSVKEHFINAI